MKTRYQTVLAAAVVGGLSVTAVSATAVQTSGIWDGNGHRYDLVPAPATWVEADVAARATSWGALGICPGHLATVTSAAENEFLDATFGPFLIGKWFGGIQPTSEDGDTGWTWANGEEWSYTNWDVNEPSNAVLPGHSHEDAAVFWFDNTWNDAARTWSYGFQGGYVVEWDCLGVTVDVKPGTVTNAVNGNDRGVIPVAIVTTPTFDATLVDPTTVTLNGATAKIRGKSGTAGALEDVDGDHDLDLVVQIVDADGVFVEGSSTAVVLAETYEGTPIKGLDTLTYVH